MAGKDVPRLSKRTVDAFAVVDKDAIFWDRDLPGFGVRVYTTGRKVYVVQTRGPGGPKRVSIGRHGEIAAEQARKQAAVIIDRIKQGLEPVPAPELTVAGLAERYLQGHVAVNCRASTLKSYRGILNTCVLPEFGELPIGAVGRAQVAALHYKFRATPYRANAAVGVLSGLFKLAEAWGLAPPGGNPCRAMRMYKTGKKHERYLTPGEYRRLGRLMDEGEADGSLRPPAVAAIRLLMLTGCRRNEILTLQWDDVDRGSGALAAEGFEDRRAHGPADAGGRGGARWHSPGCGQPLGDRGQEARQPSGEHRRGMAASAGAGRAGGCAAA